MAYTPVPSLKLRSNEFSPEDLERKLERERLYNEMRRHLSRPKEEGEFVPPAKEFHIQFAPPLPPRGHEKHAANFKGRRRSSNIEDRRGWARQPSERPTSVVGGYGHARDYTLRYPGGRTVLPYMTDREAYQMGDRWGVKKTPLYMHGDTGKVTPQQ